MPSGTRSTLDTMDNFLLQWLSVCLTQFKLFGLNKAIIATESWQNLDRISVESRQNLGITLAESWQNPGRILAESWQNPGRILAESWQNPDRILAESSELHTRRRTNHFTYLSLNQSRHSFTLFNQSIWSCNFFLS